jgi:hypothetical protein
MANKNYYTKGNKVYADVSKLTTTEKRKVKNLRDLGFELVEIEIKTTKEQKEAAKVVNPYSQQNVEKFLQRPENEELWKLYTKMYNEQAGTNRIKEGKPIADEPKFKKDGTPKLKGFAPCIRWFRSEFEYNEKAKTYEPKEKKEK